MKRLLWPIIVFAAGLGLLAFVSFEREAPIRVAILHSLSGSMAISERPVMEATLHAIEQVNAEGGLLGHRIEPIIVDGKSDPATFAKEAERLITEEKVSVIFGCWTSASRKSVKEVVEQYNHLLFYPVQYEGLEASANIIYLGAAPNQQLIPALSWAINHFGKRIYLLGSDYIFPRVANQLMHRQARLLQGEVVGERYAALGQNDFTAIVREIEQLKPDVVLNTINGDSNAAFFAALEHAAITSAITPVLSFSIAEPEIRQIGLDLSGHYTAWNYFQTLDNEPNRQFIRGFQQRFGSDRNISDPMVSAWSGVHMWASAVKIAQTVEVSVVKQSIRHASLRTPMGIISIDHETHHTWKVPRIGKIRADGQMDQVWAHTTPVRPDPFPYFFSHDEAALMLESLHRGWGNRWEPQQTGWER